MPGSSFFLCWDGEKWRALTTDDGVGVEGRAEKWVYEYFCPEIALLKEFISQKV